MSKLTPLSVNVKKIYSECIANVRNKDIKNNYEQCTDQIIDDSKTFVDYMKLNNTHRIPIKECVRNLEKEQMIKVYDDKFSKKGQPGRYYYDKIMTIPQYGLCPYCGQRIVSTLDHYMAKTKYVTLIVTPENLVPVCADCNKLKSDIIFTTLENTLINPYFFDLHSFIWLKACIIPAKSDFTIAFEVDKNLDLNLFKQLSNFFNHLNLNNLYIAHAAQELFGIKKKLISIYSVNKEINDVQNYMEELQELADGYPLNHWKKALYRGLLADNWILEEWMPSQTANI